MAEKHVCTVCKSLIKKKTISFEGKEFCCQECCHKYQHRKKNICEFC